MSRIADLIFNGAEYRITSPYGQRGVSFHYGCDYGTYLKNVPQFAIEDGVVTGKGYEPNASGYYVWITYPRINKRMLHCHLQKAAEVNKGDKVQRGTLIGYTGTTGNSTGIHLHLGVRDLTTNLYEDPEVFSATYTEPIKVLPLSEDPVRMLIGFASSGDMRQIKDLLEKNEIPYEENEGYLHTSVAVSRGDQIAILTLCVQLGVNCEIYEEQVVAPPYEVDVVALEEKVTSLFREVENLKAIIELMTAESEAFDGKLKDIAAILAK